MCVTVGVVGCLHSFTQNGKTELFCFLKCPVMPLLSNGAALVNSRSDLGLRISLYFYSQYYSKYDFKMLLYWIRLYCIGVPLLHA